MTWDLEHGVWVSDGRLGFYNIHKRAGRFSGWLHRPRGDSVLVVAKEPELEIAQRAISDFDQYTRSRDVVRVAAMRLKGDAA